MLCYMLWPMRADTVKRCFVGFSHAFFVFNFVLILYSLVLALSCVNGCLTPPSTPATPVVSCVRFHLPRPGGWLFRVVQLYMLIFGAVILLIESQSALVPSNILVVRARPQPPLP